MRCIRVSASAQSRHHMQVLKNWPERRIKVVMITTGHRVGAAGDLGVHAINATIAKLSLLTSVGGVAPALCLPVQVDLGTDNEELLKSQFYTGLRHRRALDDTAQELLHQLMNAIERRFGQNTLVFFEDMDYRSIQQLLSQYRCAKCNTSQPAACLASCSSLHLARLKLNAHVATAQACKQRHIACSCTISEMPRSFCMPVLLFNTVHTSCPQPAHALQTKIPHLVRRPRGVLISRPCSHTRRNPPHRAAAA